MILLLEDNCQIVLVKSFKTSIGNFLILVNLIVMRALLIGPLNQDKIEQIFMSGTKGEEYERGRERRKAIKEKEKTYVKK